MNENDISNNFVCYENDVFTKNPSAGHVNVTSPNFLVHLNEPGPGKLVATKDSWFGAGSILMQLQLQLNEFN